MYGVAKVASITKTILYFKQSSFNLSKSKDRSMGFVEVSDGYPDYKYVVDNIRVHKSKYRKSKLSTDLSESNYMKNNGVYKIWDCGKLKFEIILGGLT